MMSGQSGFHSSRVLLLNLYQSGPKRKSNQNEFRSTSTLRMWTGDIEPAFLYFLLSITLVFHTPVRMIASLYRFNLWYSNLMLQTYIPAKNSIHRRAQNFSDSFSTQRQRLLSKD